MYRRRGSRFRRVRRLLRRVRGRFRGRARHSRRAGLFGKSGGISL